jgi:membrane protein required for beta-lactamase induction
LRLFLDVYAPHAPLFPGWLATIGIFALVAFFAILLRLAATEEAGDIAATLRREPDAARALVKQCLTPALNFIPAIVGVGLYGAVTGLR